jgi:hypothetical protein
VVFLISLVWGLFISMIFFALALIPAVFIAKYIEKRKNVKQ